MFTTPKALKIDFKSEKKIQKKKRKQLNHSTKKEQSRSTMRKTIMHWTTQFQPWNNQNLEMNQSNEITYHFALKFQEPKISIPKFDLSDQSTVSPPSFCCKYILFRIPTRQRLRARNWVGFIWVHLVRLGLVVGLWAFFKPNLKPFPDPISRFSRGIVDD